jgi:hypothetical protein
VVSCEVYVRNKDGVGPESLNQLSINLTLSDVSERVVIFDWVKVGGPLRVYDTSISFEPLLNQNSDRKTKYL